MRPKPSTSRSDSALSFVRTTFPDLAHFKSFYVRTTKLPTDTYSAAGDDACAKVLQPLAPSNTLLNGHTIRAFRNETRLINLPTVSTPSSSNSPRLPEKIYFSPDDDFMVVVRGLSAQIGDLTAGMSLLTEELGKSRVASPSHPSEDHSNGSPP